MKKYSKNIAIALIIFILILLVVLSLGFVEVSSGVMYSLFFSMLFILSLVIIPKAFENKNKKYKNRYTKSKA